MRQTYRNVFNTTYLFSEISIKIIVSVYTEINFQLISTYEGSISTTDTVSDTCTHSRDNSTKSIKLNIHTKSPITTGIEKLNKPCKI